MGAASPDSGDLILVEPARPGSSVAVVTINRPGALNALTRPMMISLATAFRRLAAADGVAAIVLAGRGRAFCSGVDLTAAEEVFKGDVKDPAANPVAQMELCRKPIIGAVAGFAVTAGFEIALACDILVAGRSAKFLDTHAKFGIFPSWGLSQKLSRVIGPNRAREVSLTCMPITAEMGEKWGLVNHIVDDNQVLNKAVEVAEAIAKNNRNLVMLYKSVINDGLQLDLEHARALEKVPFQVPLEVNVVLIGFNGDGGYRYSLDGHKLEEFLKTSFPFHRPSCFETGEQIDIEHHIMYNVIAAGQPELISLEKSLKEAMQPAGTARENEYGREFPLFEIEATMVEPIFQRLYSFIFDMEPGYSANEMDRPVPVAIFVVNFDKVRMDPRNKEVDLDSLMYGTIGRLTEQELKKQEADYIYRYRYNGGGATQVWLSSGRFVVIDLSAGPCTYGKIETEEGSVSYRSLPRLSQIIFPRGLAAPSAPSTQDIFIGQLGGLISTTIEHVIAPDIRFETVDMTVRLLIPIIVLQNHNRYNILQAGYNYSIDVQAIEREVKKMVHPGQEVIIISGSHALHQHEQLAVAVSKAMRSHSLHETKSDGRFHVRTKTYLDGAILKEEMERSADVLSAGLLEVANPSLSSRYFLKQHWTDEQDDIQDSIKHKPLWESYMPRNQKGKRGIGKKKHGSLYRTYGTRVIPVFVLSLADVDAELLMEEESLVWTSKDVVIVLEHKNENIPLSYVSETTRQFAVPSLAQRHILAGLAAAVGGLSAPYERASHIHERPIVNWLWAAGCHPFGPFSNTSQISQILQDVSLRTTIYARVDAALRKIRDTSESVQSFASEHLKTPLGELVKGNKNKSSTELWVEKFYKKVTTLPEPFPHGLVERLEEYLDRLEGQLVDLSSLLYDHRLVDAYQNSSDILQSTIFTQQYVERVLYAEKEKMKCCSIEYSHPKQSSQAFVYGGILLAGFLVYSLVIFFSSPVR